MSDKNQSPITLVIALICIAAYGFAIIYGVIQISRNVKLNRITAEKEFYDLADSSSSRGPAGFMDTVFQQEIQNSLAQSRTLRGVIVSGPDGEYAFERELSGAINWVEDSPRFSRHFGFSSKTLFVPLRIEGLRNVTISAVYTYINNLYIVSVLKKCLFIVLAALFVSFIALVLETLTSKKETENASEEEEPYSERPVTAGKGQQYRQMRYSAAPKTAPRQTAPPPPPETDFTSFDQGEDPGIDDIDALFPKDEESAVIDEDFFKSVEDSLGSKTEVSKERPAESSESAEWEAPVLEKLKTELHNCASGEQDLAVALFEYGNSDDPEGIWFNEFLRMVGDYFTNRDLIFGKDRNVAVIIPEASLEQGIERVEEFKAKIPTTFNQQLSVGLSSRAGRLMNADLLLFEAENAKNRSKQDPAFSVIAFKSDPEKYRALLKRKSAV
ncbi:MAG: hypothetical protein LBT16_13940 [Treponema sp.]|jgi:hypothetical protein|nr:hypothetical protein [Treponema sp.]